VREIERKGKGEKGRERARELERGGTERRRD
jgi:hypothetical protein